MEAIDGTPTQKPSLIVKLHYKPLCPKCRDLLSRWCTPSSVKYPYWTLQPEHQLWARESLNEAAESSHDQPTWTYHVRTLRASSASCSCCDFLVRVLDTVSDMQSSDEDYLQLSSEFVGSQHVTPYQRAYEDWLSRGPSGYGLQNDRTTQYMRYYRPYLQVFQAVTDATIYKPYHHDPDKTWYLLKTTNFILPSAQANSKVSETIESTEAFLGRPFNPHVNFSLIRSWIAVCASTHHGKRDSYPTDKFEERSTEPAGCRPKSPSLLPNFRLVDITNRCVVRINQPTEYAALSYVWGKAKRLLLRKDNEVYLSTPGVLSADNADVPKTFEDAFAVADNLSIRYLWIDGLCICQDDSEQLQQHMESMEEVYSSAILTIVSDTWSADTGIPGISLARGPPQASFKWAGTTYLSARKTFAEALVNSPWESRAWCLQEKVFSRRLLIFTESQTFYHCSAATWFEDTVTEQKDNISGAVHLREKSSPKQKGYSGKPRADYTAYEAHREFFGRNFWSLVKVYSKRQLSFESDTIRAFTGILKSLEAEFGPAIWGIPSNEFTQGLTWAHSPHRMDSRREGFPSWSWAGWRCNTGIDLDFKNCKRTDADLRVSRGRYRVRGRDFVGTSVWTLDWHHYIPAPSSGTCDLKPISEIGTKATRVAPVNDPTTYNGDGSLDSNPEQALLAKPRSIAVINSHSWRLPGHPRAKDEAPEIMETYASDPKAWKIPVSQLSQVTLPESVASSLTMPPLEYKPDIMPPLSHIIRFYTSVATCFIGAEPDPELELWSPYRSYDSKDADKRLHKVCLPNSQEHIGIVELDPKWQGKGQSHTLIYISRWCPEFLSYEKEERYDYDRQPEKLNVLLVESVKGWGEVKRRVQMLDLVDLLDWRKAEPRWEVMSLA